MVEETSDEDTIPTDARTIQTTRSYGRSMQIRDYDATRTQRQSHCLNTRHGQHRQDTVSSFANEALSMTYETILSGAELTDKEFNYRSHTGSSLVPCEVLTDSWSLHLAGKPGNSKLPHKKSLRLVLAALRERIKTSRIRHLGWCNTREMVADGLSKSTVPKDALMLMCRTAALNLSSMIWP
eukprot:1451702-Amphidinium_carterae.1